MMADARHYRFHPLERRGIVLGLGAGQLAVVGAGILLAFLALRAHPGGTGIVVAVTLVVGAVVGALLPVHRRTLSGWAPVAAAWWAKGRRGRGPRWDGREGMAPVGVRILDAPAEVGDDRLGLVHDRRSGAYAVVLPVAGRGFSLLDPDDQRRRLAAWGAVLATAARPGSPVHRIQWVERTHVGDDGSLEDYLREAADPGAPPEALAGYRTLIARAAPTTARHDVHLVLAMHPRRAGRALRPFGGARVGGVSALLRREVRLVQGQLRNAELRPAAALGAGALVEALRALPAGPSRRRIVRGAGVRAHAGADPWPMGIEEHWAAVRVDDSWQAVYWVAEWPRLAVGPDFLAPLLLVGGVRAVSVTMAPVAPDRARREAESARTADLADDEIRRRTGFLTTARHRREAEGARHREVELADGHAEYRFSGYVVVSGADPEGLESACAAVEQAAQQSYLELRRLYGQQQEALSWTLPLGRGVA